jgi:hypothetical protein
MSACGYQMGLAVLIHNHIDEYYDASMASYGVQVSILTLFACKVRKKEANTGGRVWANAHVSCQKLMNIFQLSQVLLGCDVVYCYGRIRTFHMSCCIHFHKVYDGSCEHGNETSGSIQGEEFLD